MMNKDNEYINGKKNNRNDYSTELRGINGLQLAMNYFFDLLEESLPMFLFLLPPPNSSSYTGKGKVKGRGLRCLERVSTVDIRNTD
jgi:hypothetical protein